MNDNEIQPTLPEMLLQVAELFDEYVDACEQNATQIMKELGYTF